jgi:hypothetical protein
VQNQQATDKAGLQKDIQLDRAELTKMWKAEQAQKKKVAGEQNEYARVIGLMSIYPYVHSMAKLRRCCY